MCDCIFLGCLGACAAAVFLATFYFFFGVIFISFASSAKNAVSTYQDILAYDVSLFPNLCMIIGFLFTLLTVLGFLGQKRGRKTRIFYGVAQTLVVILGFYIYIDAYPNEAKLDKHLLAGLNNTIKDYGLDAINGTKSVTETWDRLQEDLECCGVNNYLDWQNIKPFGHETPPTPISCCHEEHRMEGCSIHVPYDHPAEANKIIHVQGCLERIRSELLGRMGILHYFLIPILFITSIGIVVTCCSSGVKADTVMTEKKVGPIIVRTRSRKGKYDVAGTKEANDVEGDMEFIDKEAMDADANEGKSQTVVEMEPLKSKTEDNK